MAFLYNENHKQYLNLFDYLRNFQMIVINYAKLYTHINVKITFLSKRDLGKKFTLKAISNRLKKLLPSIIRFHQKPLEESQLNELYE